MPKGFLWVRNAVKTIVTYYSALGYQVIRPFARSIWPAVTYNLLPWPEVLDHTDGGNAVCIPCSVSPQGPYDADRSAHFILFDLFLLIRFPAGSTIHICSGGMCHGTTPIHEDDKRSCIIQYCAGGLQRHIDYGFRTEEELRKTKPALLRKIMRGGEERIRQAVKLFSTAASLDEDRKLLL
jgi:hypothetical protein